MKTLTTTDLNHVAGGLSKSADLSNSLSQINSSLSSLTQNKNSGGFDSTTRLMLVLAMSQNKNSGPTVIAGGGAPAYAAAPVAYGGGGPVINVSTRVRSRGWW